MEKEIKANEKNININYNFKYYYCYNMKLHFECVCWLTVLLVGNIGLVNINYHHQYLI